MTDKMKTTLLGITLTLVLLIAYFFIRPGMVERSYIRGIESTANSISLVFNSFQRDRRIFEKDIPQFKRMIESRFGPQEFLAIANREGTVINKDDIDRGSELYYSIIQNFEGNLMSRAPGMLVRYHNGKKNYILVTNVTGGSMITVYPFRLTKMMYIKLSLEIALIVLVSILIAALSYILRHRRPRPVSKPEYRDITATRPQTSSPINEDAASRELSNFASSSLGEYVFELFRQITAGYSPDLVSLYAMNRGATAMAKSFEMKGRSFIKIESDDFDTIDIMTEVGDELKRGSTLVLDNGRKIMLPAMYRNALLGAIIVVRGIPFKGQEITEIKARLADIARYLSEYIFFNDVAVEPETGLYSRTYFNLKLREQKKALQSNGTPFSLLLLSFFGADTNLQAGEFQAAVRGVAAKLAPALGEGDIICRTERDIAILLPGTGLDESITVGERIAEMLQAARIRIDKKNSIALHPYIGIASSEKLDPNDDFLDTARRYLDLAKEREEGTVQYSRIVTV